MAVIKLKFAAKESFLHRKNFMNRIRKCNK